MKENRSNMIIALMSVAAAIVMCLALSFAIGKWNFGNTGTKITIKFANVTGITPNAQVKLAGVPVGRVMSIQLIPRQDEDQDPKTGLYNCVAMVINLDKGVEVGHDVTAVVKQDGFGIAPKYVNLTPGPDHAGPALADNDVIQGEPPFDLSDLIQPAGEALTQAQHLVEKLGPALDKLQALGDLMSAKLPALIDNGNRFLSNGNDVLANFNTPDGKERLQQTLDSLRVSLENLKVVTTNAKALTQTLAEKPWRVIWGGATVQPPPEDQVLDSNHVIRLKPAVDVDADKSVPAPK
ncbi:MAG TPA: MlaD family protein [Candidatus Methylacidiphilales bacterium]|jgi:virulence factor Mce-like protein|nr:MlaD family protein [Candidatus Methylacidiphilales bacterium]